MAFTRSASGDVPSSDSLDWNSAFSTYARDPYHNRHALLALRGHHTADLHPIYLLGLADAQLRGRRYAAARQRFSEVIDQGVPQPFAAWAAMGLGWAAMAQGDYSAARDAFASVTDVETASAPAASLAVGLIDAAEERPGIDDRLSEVVSDERATPAVQQAARLGAAYARYWAQDYLGAAEAFDEIAVDREAGPLADDARYAAAWARLHGGQRAAARAALEQEAQNHRRRNPAQPTFRPLVNLEPQAVIRAGFLRYRRGRLRPPEDEVAAVLDGDGTALARAALRWMNEEEAGSDRLGPRPPLTALHAARDSSLSDFVRGPLRLPLVSGKMARPTRTSSLLSWCLAILMAAAIGIALFTRLWRPRSQR